MSVFGGMNAMPLVLIIWGYIPAALKYFLACMLRLVLKVSMLWSLPSRSSVFYVS